MLIFELPRPPPPTQVAGRAPRRGGGRHSTRLEQLGSLRFGPGCLFPECIPSLTHHSWQVGRWVPLRHWCVLGGSYIGILAVAHIACWVSGQVKSKAVN